MSRILSELTRTHQNLGHCGTESFSLSFPDALLQHRRTIRQAPASPHCPRAGTFCFSREESRGAPEGSLMKTYRAFVVASEGQILHSVDLVCATEDRARRLAERLC